MKKSKDYLLDSFFRDIDPQWQHEIPELSAVFEEERFSPGERLINDWGELYLIVDGIFGKYEKTCPVRYALAGESLMIPNHKHRYQFIALSDCRTYRTSLRQLEEINAHNPKVFYLYANLTDKQQTYLDYRHKLLSLNNQDKFDFVFNKYPDLRSYVKHHELARFMGISSELLRRLLRDHDC
ncbi:cyclic nucleotide-binding domain-containing protein [Sphingobacterium sp. B29]|uniref:cyclic nucleotide-binding domain-containing protein n=1 Tax=Sphingobacterium sp. B29 TaxID=1933220 RepID=UPI0012F82A89|nr:cyclic nucleotide-binding domain-containing protein [Sphingobacterium sp. B29]